MQLGEKEKIMNCVIIYSIIPWIFCVNGRSLSDLQT